MPSPRNIKRNESRTILVIVPYICDPFFADVIQGIEQTAAQQGYLVLIGDCAQQNQQERTFVNLIITKQIDGMLLLGSNLPFDASKEEQRNLPPMVMANEFAPGAGTADGTHRQPDRCLRGRALFTSARTQANRLCRRA
jgi:LacI family repressor for deo operon, udp, cdd, tsx, nupC, and nupG